MNEKNPLQVNPDQDFNDSRRLNEDERLKLLQDAETPVTAETVDAILISVLLARQDLLLAQSETDEIKEEKKIIEKALSNRKIEEQEQAMEC